MVKKLLGFLFLSALLLAGELDDKVIHLIGYAKYNKNRAILNSIFLDPQRYRTSDGRVDTLKVVRVLKRLGFIRLRYDRSVDQTIRFTTYGDVHPFMKLMFDALANSAVFNYAIDSAVKNSDGYAVTVRYTASFAPDPARIVATFQDAGMIVSDVRRQGRDWSYVVGGESVRLNVPQVRGGIELKGLKDRYWCKASGSVHIVSHAGNHWHPAVYVYDMQLRPVKSVLLYREHRSLDIALPNGSYYITIADRFSAKNIQSGFTVSIR